MENPQYIRAIYYVTPILLWPVVWLRVFQFKRLIARLEAEGYAGIGYVWDSEGLCFRITRLDKYDAPDPLATRPRMEFVYAMAGYMPHNLWALTFNTVPLFRDMTRGASSAVIPAFALLDPG